MVTRAFVRSGMTVSVRCEPMSMRRDRVADTDVNGGMAADAHVPMTGVNTMPVT